MIRVPSEFPRYIVTHLRRALAEDPRTRGLAIGVTLHGPCVHLSGRVTSQECRHALNIVLREHLPSAVVRNDVRVER
ncbi:hypothetical protein GCM10023094_34130 [Rhodococcus olei]|uniref:BON domain-containing protein n=1 Tax=Rhodococcus olei TaxID=2161675 RepID=A0ABP8P9K8_9NOCA